VARLTKDKVRKAIEEKGGLLADVARCLGVSRRAVYNFLEKYPDLKEGLEWARSVTDDKAESRLFELIDSEDEKVALKAVIFYLSNRARHRGYNTEKEEKKDQGPIVISLEGFPRPPDAES